MTARAMDAERPAEVIWHEVECGRYRADLRLWRELAAAAAPRSGSASVLDIGAGIGRVSLDLAEAGHRVTALDISSALLEELARRAGELPVRTVVGDARRFELDQRDFDICIVPMQTLQLLRGERERAALFRCAAAHVRPGAPIACAIVTAVEEFDSLAGQLGPSPDRMALGERAYFSRPLSVRLLPEAIRIERERVVLPAADTGSDRWRDAGERDVVELAVVTEEQLWSEAERAGLDHEATRVIGETEEHAASEVVVLRA